VDRDSWRILIDNASQFPSVLPDFPIYVFLLPKEAQDAIGAIHPNTQPAMAMLKQEGFVDTDEVDFFDAGPKIRADRMHIRTIKESRTATVATLSQQPLHSERMILCNQKTDFRACFGSIEFTVNGGAIVQRDVAEALCVEPGDVIRYVTPTANSQKDASL
jgi:arginine N-succinyltransferase